MTSFDGAHISVLMQGSDSDCHMKTSTTVVVGVAIAGAVVGGLVGAAIMLYHWRVGKAKDEERIRRQGKEYRNMIDAV